MFLPHSAQPIYRFHQELPVIRQMNFSGQFRVLLVCFIVSSIETCWNGGTRTLFGLAATGKLTVTRGGIKQRQEVRTFTRCAVRKTGNSKKQVTSARVQENVNRIPGDLVLFNPVRILRLLFVLLRLKVCDLSKLQSNQHVLMCIRYLSSINLIAYI